MRKKEKFQREHEEVRETQKKKNKKDILSRLAF